MTTTINNKNKKPNVPNKREQNQTCLDSAEREGLRPKGNVPNLRFPEFQGEWEKCTFDKIAQYKKGPFGSALKKDIFVPQSKDTIKVYEQQNAIKKDWTLSRYYITKGYFNSHMKQFVAKAGDLIVSCAGTIGEIYELPQDAEEGVFNQALMRVQVNDEAVNKEIFITVFSSMIDKFSKIYSNGSAIKNIPPFADLKKTQVFLPCKEEQKKIAKLLALLDERIATQNKIIDKLQSLIKGMEDNLLDNPLWKKTYLRSFMQFFPTNSLSWEQLSYKEGAIRNLHYGLIHDLQTRGINSTSLPMIKNEAIPKQYTLCQVGDVAFADASEDTGEIAKSVEFVDTIEGDTICGLHTIHGRDIKNRTVVGFKGFAFNSRYFHNQIKRLAQGTKVFSITANNLSSCYVYLPDLDTQKAIVKLLKAYEEKLLVSKRLLEQYEKQKQYLLRQMFI